ncbi:hypothetical protein ACVWU4_000879 [Campylobacter coli]
MSAVVNVEELLKFEPKEMLDGLKTDLKIKFQDGVVEDMPYREVILLRYILEVFKHIPGTKIVSKFRPAKYYVNGSFSSKTIIEVCENIFQAAVEEFLIPNNGKRSMLNDFYDSLYGMLNTIYNEVIFSKLHYAPGINIEDFLEIQYNPKLIKALQKLEKEPNPDNVNACYTVLDNLLRNEYKGNPVAEGYMAGFINSRQIYQMLGPRGYIAELDGKIFSKPITSSFVLGMKDIYESAVESTSARKALSVSTEGIKKTEYFARELQLVAMYIENLVDGDCGSKEYIVRYVRPDNGKGVSDLKTLLGKRYLNEETGKEEYITNNHKHLIGKTIKLRSPLTCKHPDKRCVCSACFGQLSYAIAETDNLGHACSVEVTRQVSQTVLSFKHLMTSSNLVSISLDEIASEFLMIKDNNYLIFKPGIFNSINTKIELVIEQTQAFGLKDLNNQIDIYKLQLSSVSSIKDFIIRVTNKQGVVTEYPINLNPTKGQKKYSLFTYEFIQHCLDGNTSLDDDERFIINITNYNKNDYFLYLPEVEFNFLGLASSIKSEFKHLQVMTGIASKETPESKLHRLYELLNTKFDINIAIVEVIVYAFTVCSLRLNNYDIGRHSDDKQLLPIRTIIKNRSLGAAYGWENVIKIIFSASSFNGNNAVSHPLDVLFTPNEVLLERNGTVE